LYPFSVEAAAEACAGVERAALIGCDGRRILAAQIGGVDEHDVRAALELALHWAALDEIRIVSRIPVDPRHNAKVDYMKLRAALTAPGRRQVVGRGLPPSPRLRRTAVALAEAGQTPAPEKPRRAT
jgi:hypothetical protein